MERDQVGIDVDINDVLYLRRLVDAFPDVAFGSIIDVVNDFFGSIAIFVGHMAGQALADPTVPGGAKDPTDVHSFTVKVSSLIMSKEPTMTEFKEVMMDIAEYIDSVTEEKRKYFDAKGCHIKDVPILSFDVLKEKVANFRRIVMAYGRGSMDAHPARPQDYPGPHTPHYSYSYLSPDGK